MSQKIKVTVYNRNGGEPEEAEGLSFSEYGPTPLGRGLQQQEEICELIRKIKKEE